MNPNKIEIVDCRQRENVPEYVLSSCLPLLLKNMVSHWPSVQAELKGLRHSADYIRQFATQQPLTVYRGEPDIEGRIFYNEDFTDVNFQRLKMPLGDVLDELLGSLKQDKPPSYYVGSSMVDHWLPGFRTDNDLGLDMVTPLVSLWFGNQSKIAAHFDFPSNIACNVAGRRRFTLFPPDQIDNLYVGPLDFTPSGQAISLVDTTNPDFDKFPNYQHALESSISVELDAGDAIFIPSMWWHHVHALDAFNVLVNYWWRATPSYLGAPANALQHAIMTMHGLPVEQKRAWRNIFDRYVFNEDDQAFKHIPEQARGVLADVNETTAQAIKARLVRFLK